MLADFYKDTMSESTIRSKTRRFIAKAVILNIFAIFWLCVIAVLIGTDIAAILALVTAFHMGEAFLMVLAFFFGGYYLGRYQDKRRKAAKKSAKEQ